MKENQAYQITVTLDVADHTSGRVLLAAIDATLRSRQDTHAFHWFCEGEIVPCKVYQQCEFHAHMAVDEERESQSFDAMI